MVDIQDDEESELQKIVCKELHMRYGNFQAQKFFILINEYLDKLMFYCHDIKGKDRIVLMK